ncbi:SDR family oxidoreductase [Frigoribacterium endophyticum]|uniref:SDR family oxidoreductase n=1 Tax=Frigoribacterium endophyticum TaxID=1522176 RepID=UPI00141E648D|nr:SDR family oxidoreductase [Frigoribacterium endophyticum]NII52408.1 NAD(P)-dependent dehydrogenase (short-subunit alcohol dehydrogenase family) [Frigoribacterium endophyticum]
MTDTSSSTGAPGAQSGRRGPGRVVVTGGASGLGAAVAHAVQQAGGTPIVLDLDVSRVPEGIESHRVDVSDSTAVEAAVTAAAEAHDGLDAVVTAAGVDTPAPLDGLSTASWEKIVGVNLFGTVSTVRAALPHLKASHGKVVTVASSLGIKAVGDATAYCASKFGVVGFTRSLAAELKGVVGVTTLIPSGMATRFFDARDEQYKPQDDSRLQDPADVADAVLYVLGMPARSEIRELVVTHPEEDSWP